MRPRADLYRLCWLVLTLLFGTLSASGGVWAQQAESGITLLPAPIQSSNDTRQYRQLRLANGLQVLLISDPATDKAAASLDVHVGNADDPVDRGGLAHFLEHMLFLGTEKYPEADEYQRFISSHGGTHNAFTAPEHTNYFFDIDQAFLQDALDRFAQFFIAPLFTEEYVDRERHAVYSEYMAKINDSYRREYDVYREVVNPRHPLAKFGVGSLETLADRPDDPVREDLIQFYQHYYSSTNMRLVVLGRESLDTLQGWVAERFVDVPRREVAAFVSGVPMFREQTLPLRLHIKPLKQEHRLNLLFPIPPAERYYDQKPLEYLGNLLGHEGEGSLLSLLKELGWAERLSAGGGYLERNESTFNISIELTPEGYKEQNSVVALVMRVIKKIRQEGVDAWRFDEMESLAELDFRFAEKEPPINWVMTLANSMHTYEPVDVIRGRYAFDDFDERLIKRYLKFLVPENLLWVVTAPEVQTTMESAYFKAPYAVEPLVHEVAMLPKAYPEKLELPKPNHFIPKRFQVKAMPSLSEAGVNPHLIKATNEAEVWFKQDDLFKVPRSVIKIRALSPLVGENTANAAMAHLYSALVNDSLNEYAYPAALAGLAFNVTANSRGFDMEVSGYNDRQGLLLNRILSVIERGRFERNRFDRLKQELVRKWRNQTTRPPYEQLFRQAPAMLFSPYWDETTMADALEQVSWSDFRHYSNQLWIGSTLKVLMFGNLYEQEALQFATLIEHHLHKEPKDPVEMPAAKVLHLPKAVQHSELITSHQDVAVMLYQQALSDSIEDQAAMMMLRQMQSASFFHELRTQQQLGYIVFASALTLKDVAGGLWVVQSPSASMTEVVSAIDQFYRDNVAQVVDFERHQQALLVSLTETPKTLNEQADQYWSEVISDAPQFDRRDRLVAAVRALTPESMAVYGKRLLKSRQRLWMLAGPAAAELPESVVGPRMTLPDSQSTGKFYVYP